jgi:hypothetical protein
MHDVFRSIILIGRPAAGKSEVIDYLKRTPTAERSRRFHIGELVEIDDFPFLWEKFEEDDLLEAHGRPRQWTTSDYWFTDDWFWTFMILKINRAYERFAVAGAPGSTALVEFSRGGPNGFGAAFSLLSEAIRRESGLVYIRVSYEESVRKNQRRHRPGQEHSVLHHSLPDAKMEHYYKTNDWDAVSGGRDAGEIDMAGLCVPFVVFDNEPEVTDRPEALGDRLEEVCARLWRTMAKRV